ncbi:TesB Acyl-CoA thioesterase [Pyrenophora tritici-repentis]|nr:TesB Acyl-CoA thioesterase [Pyrenophora tritici-repentis]PWO29450.1 CaiA, Acyl-CoA dehydrogenase [Pyrenophora tritici-repentis]
MATLIRPPPADPSQSDMESVLELTSLSDIDPNLFTNTRPLWHPPGARGIFGGAAIAQTLSAAQKTVDPDFTVHSMHCYFVLAGNAEIPIIYHVERVRSGKSYATRTVQARQRGRVIFTTTMSFVKQNSGGAKKVEHAYPMPDVPGPIEDLDDQEAHTDLTPFQSQRLPIENDDSDKPHTKKCRQWMRARGRISPAGGHEAHLSAIAYMSDSYFIGTVARTHKLWRYSTERKNRAKSSIDEDVLKKLLEMDDAELKRQKFDAADMERIRRLKNGEDIADVAPNPMPEIGMMVSLDHTIYFHNPRSFRADEWIFTEMETPWAGDGRGLVFQRMYTQDGTLIASCVQEGLVRLKQNDRRKKVRSGSPEIHGANSVSKRSGLEKAIYQVEEAIKKRKSDAFTSQSTLQQLQQLLNEAQRDEGSSREADTDDQLAVEDVENPLQLLARASDLRIATPQSYDPSISSPDGKFNGSEQSAYLDVHHFFLPTKAHLDQGPGLDPIDVGLVTKDEAEMLLQYFHKKLAHTRWGLDPLVHTLSFVRNRSAFLFTTLLAMTAIFLPETSALAKRLLLHRRFLAEQVIIRKYRSVEIVLAFMVSIPWMPPGSHASDDDTSHYLATALSIALDLMLDKVITPSTSFEQEFVRKIPKAECLNARKALAMDGFEDVDPTSEWGQRLLRRRERVWIALFVLERGVCLARGRSYCVPKTCLIMYSDKWHYHQYADVQDGSLVSMAVLRRDLDDLFAEVRTRCDNYGPDEGGSKIAQEIDRSIEDFFDNWSRAWPSVISDPESKSLPPYVEILVTHTRLSTYSMLLNHPSAPPEVKRSFRKSALSSALNVMRAAIQGESRLKSMPNNTVTMICFAASVALALSAPVPEASGNKKSLAPSVRHLIEDTATVLERIGSKPSHRNGASLVYGRFLRVLVKQAPDIDSKPSVPQHSPALSMAIPALLSPAHVDGASPNNHTDPVTGYWSDTLDFSAMSYNEVNETVTNSDLFSAALLDLPWSDSNPLWTDWMSLPDFNYP